MSASIAKKSLGLLSSLLFLSPSLLPVESEAIRQADRLYAEGDEIVLNVYNSADYIAEDESDDNGKVLSKGLIHKFEDFCREHGKNVRVAYSTFDTNETMLGELKTGKVSYDLVCPSDYVIQKMIRENMIVPYDKTPTDFTLSYRPDAASATPYYDENVSRWVTSQMQGIEVDGKDHLVDQYTRGYMWGTLGILYNDEYPGFLSRGFSAEKMDQDMQDWRSLWKKDYNNLLAIKDSMRDTYAIGVLYTFYDEFLKLKKQYENKEISESEYHKSANRIFNRADDETLSQVEKSLRELKHNAFGFEVDSGKTDMAQGNKFAINIAWSGDAAYAMSLAEENNLANEERGNEERTYLKYALPATGANVWFDGWVMPQSVLKNPENKAVAEAFVDFISMPENVIQNMDYIGYTSVIAGDDVLDYVKGNYDLRYETDEEGNVNKDESLLDGYIRKNPEEIAGLTEEEKEHSYYSKSIDYFFDGTLNEHSKEDTTFAIPCSEKDGKFDSQYPDESLLPSLCIMADFGAQTDKLLSMWEKVKNTNLPLWAYILIIVIILFIIVFFLLRYIRRRNVLKRRKERKKIRQEKQKKAIEEMKRQEKLKKKEDEAKIKANKELRKQAKIKAKETTSLKKKP